MHIVHIESSLNWGGQELRIVDQTEWLLDHGHKSLIIARPKSKILLEAKKRKLPFLEFEIRGSVNFIQIKKLIRILLDLKPDILDAHSSRDASYAMFAKLLTDTSVIRSRHVTDRIKNDFFHSLIWKYGNDAIVTTSNKIKDDLVRLGLSGKDKIFVAPAGVDENRFRHPFTNDLLKHRLNIPSANKVIANIGMIRPDKGQIYFVKMCEILAEKYKNLTFLQIGEATDNTQGYKQLVLDCVDNSPHKDRIRFLGYKYDIENYLAISDIVVISSIHTEAQTRLIAQSFLMKKNVVATNIGGLSEMIIDRQTGLLCKAEDSLDLADKVALLLENESLKNQLSENAYIHGKKFNTFDYMMNFMLEVYSKTIPNRREKPQSLKVT